MSLQNFKKKLHKLLIAEKSATGADGKDKGSEVKITELMKTFQNQDAFDNEDETVRQADFQINSEQMQMLSRADKEWLQIDDE